MIERVDSQSPADKPSESPLVWIVFVHADPQGYDYRIFADEQEAHDVAGEDERNGEAIPLYRASAFTRSAAVRTIAVTQCLTAGSFNSVSEGERLVCAKCGCPAFQQMQYFPYDLHPHADYPHGHPERCTKRDAWAEGLEREGKQGWRCHKRLGHSAGNGGEHCSTHRDCGFVRDGAVCGLLPDHDGPHAGEGEAVTQSASVACPACAAINARRCTNPKPVGDSACDCCQHHWHAIDKATDATTDSKVTR